MESLIRVTRGGDGSVARVMLNRPDLRNAFNAQLIDQLRRAFLDLSGERSVRAIVLGGEGPVFCGGADIAWMRDSLELSEDENLRDAEALADMFRAIDSCPKPVIARVQGAAVAGGTGLCATADVVVAADNAVFGFTETKVGLIPATIAPFVIEKIGVSHARALFLTGERFSAQRALAIGLVHEIAPESELDVRVERILAELMSAGPTATGAAKHMIRELCETTYDAARDVTASAIAERRTTAEAQEGLRAFLERRKANWLPK